MIIRFGSVTCLMAAAVVATFMVDGFAGAAQAQECCSTVAATSSATSRSESPSFEPSVAVARRPLRQAFDELSRANPHLAHCHRKQHLAGPVVFVRPVGVGRF
jgi:hypothetical protein